MFKTAGEGLGDLRKALRDYEQTHEKA